MSNHYPSALELFEKFRPRFEEVRLVPNGWNPVMAGNPEAYQYLRMKICRDTEEIQGEDNRTSPYLDFAKSSVPFSFMYDRTKPGTIHQQMTTGVMQAVSEQLLAGRTFRLRPAEAFTKIELFHGGERSRFMLTLDGSSIPGLKLQSHMEGKWPCFVPAHSPEGKAVFAAALYEHERSGDCSYVAQVKASLDEALQKVA